MELELLERTDEQSESKTASAVIAEILKFLYRPEQAQRLAQYKKFYRISNLQGAWSIGCQWLIIAASIYFAHKLNTWWASALAIFVISTRQNALSLIVHEATHMNTFSSRFWNDVIVDFFCGFPTNLTVNRYRAEHVLHHKFLMTDDDPYYAYWITSKNWSWPKTMKESTKLFLRDVFGINLKEIVSIFSAYSPISNHFKTKAPIPALSRRERLSFYLFVLTLVVGLTTTHAWLGFFLYWVLPLSTLNVLWIRVRTIAEHLGLPLTDIFTKSREVRGRIIETLTLAPLNINYHFTHHLLPAVPYYNLRDMHNLLLNVPVFRDELKIYDEYLGTTSKSAYHELIK